MPENTVAYLLLVAAVLLGIAVVRLRRRQWELRRTLTAYRREQRAVVEFLHRVGEHMRSRLALDDTLATILSFVVESTNAHAGAVFLCDEEDPGCLQAHVVHGPFPPLHPAPDKIYARRQFLVDKVKKEKIRLGEGIVGRVAQEGRPLLIADARTDPELVGVSHGVVPIETLMASPLTSRHQLLGVIVLINRLPEGTPFAPEDLDLLVALADQAAMSVNLVQAYKELGEKQRLEQELKVAKDLQKMMLPRVFPQVSGLELAGLSEPALEVGGDYFDFFDVDADHLGIVIADVAGKGIPGALVMATVRITLRAEALGDNSPRSVLLRVNRQLVRDVSPGVFVTMTYAVLDRRSLRLRFARAGHEPIIVCGANGGDQPRLYTPNGIALGLVADDTFTVTEEKEIELHDREVAILYTDGVIEARNPAEEEYGIDRLIDSVRSHVDRSAPEIAEGLKVDVSRFARGQMQHDDLTIVVLKACRGAGQESPASRSGVRSSGTG